MAHRISRRCLVGNFNSHQQVSPVYDTEKINLEDVVPVVKQEVNITVKASGDSHRSQRVLIISNALFNAPLYRLCMRASNSWTWPREKDFQFTRADLIILVEQTWEPDTGSSYHQSAKQSTKALRWVMAVSALLNPNIQML